MRRILCIAAGLVLAAAAPAVAAPRPAGGSTAPGQVFAPNPVADLGIQTLTDQKDADYFSADPTLARAYQRVTLTDLDGTGALAGAYAKVISETGKARPTPAAVSSTRATRTSSSRPWVTTGSPRRSATSNRWASARPCAP